jgi:Coenzyme PQQ synthesis protein D (PqqD)
MLNLYRCGLDNSQMSQPCFRINSPSVIFERFDDEVVAIHMDKGTYHSMAGSAADAFLLLADEASAGELANALSNRYAATPEQIGSALAPFLEQLQSEQLIVPVVTPKRQDPLRIPGGETGLPFGAPSLQAFRDLEGLLLLDPVHEVGDEGWPPPAEPKAQ